MKVFVNEDLDTELSSWLTCQHRWRCTLDGNWKCKRCRCTPQQLIRLRGALHGT